MKLPSKELLSEVLGFSISNCWNDGNLIVWKEDGMSEINVFELAHKCKEWAVKQGYNIRLESCDYLEDDSFSGMYWWINRLRATTWQEQGCLNCGANSTEPEAVFTACEWILQNKG